MYEEIVNKYQLRERLHEGFVIYGEIYGDGIQKGYTYGCKAGEHKLVVFDVQVIPSNTTSRYLDADSAELYALDSGLPFVPIIFRGHYSHKNLTEIATGRSILNDSQSVREGIVVKPMHERFHPNMGRMIAKYINPEYLLKDQTEFH